MPLTVTVVDDQEPNTIHTVHVADGDYLLITVDPCREKSIQVYGGGKTHVITITDRRV